MKSTPNKEECLQILEKTNCPQKVIQHSKKVRDIALKIASKIPSADLKTVEAGALLHDIGRSKTHQIKHITEGVKTAEKLGLPRKIIKIIERHGGAGISKEEAPKLGLPPKDYTPKTLEEKIVCHADNLTCNSKKQKIEKQIEKALQEHHKKYALRLMKLHKELSKMYGENLNKI